MATRSARSVGRDCRPVRLQAVTVRYPDENHRRLVRHVRDTHLITAQFQFTRSSNILVVEQLGILRLEDACWRCSQKPADHVPEVGSGVKTHLPRCGPHGPVLPDADMVAGQVGRDTGRPYVNYGLRFRAFALVSSVSLCCSAAANASFVKRRICFQICALASAASSTFCCSDRSVISDASDSCRGHGSRHVAVRSAHAAHHALGASRRHRRTSLVAGGYSCARRSC
jgi:hypothetical protein